MEKSIDKKRCYFCDCVLNSSKESKRAREHIFKKDWLDKLDYLQIQMNFDTFANNQKTRNDTPTANAVQAGLVCELCNRGWMNTTDKNIEKEFFELLEDASLIDNLDERQEFNLARYVFKTGMAAMSMQVPFNKTIPLEIRKAVIKEDFLPEGFICLAHIENDPNFNKGISCSLLHTWGTTPFTENSLETGQIEFLSGFKFCIRFNSLVLGFAFIDVANPCFYYDPDFYKLIYVQHGTRYQEEKRKLSAPLPKDFHQTLENYFNLHIYVSASYKSIRNKLKI